MVVPSLIYGCKNWTVQKKQGWRTKTQETKHVRSVAGYTVWSMITKMNEQIRKEINTHNLHDIVDYRCNWTQHLLRMRDTHIPKLVHMYILAGRTNIGQPRERRKPPHMKTEQAWLAYTPWLIIMKTYRNSNEISSLIILLHLVWVRTWAQHNMHICLPIFVSCVKAKKFWCSGTYFLQ
jgi:hypothetical protein